MEMHIHGSRKEPKHICLWNQISLPFACFTDDKVNGKITVLSKGEHYVLITKTLVHTFHALEYTQSTLFVCYSVKLHPFLCAHVCSLPILIKKKKKEKKKSTGCLESWT